MSEVITTQAATGTGATWPYWRRWVLAIVIGLLVGSYFTGRLDHALYSVGLNFKQCARNGFGAVFCGSELTAYQDRLRSLAIHPIQPLPGATASEWETYQTAERAYCSLNPQGEGC